MWMERLLGESGRLHSERHSVVHNVCVFFLVPLSHVCFPPLVRYDSREGIARRVTSLAAHSPHLLAQPKTVVFTRPHTDS